MCQNDTRPLSKMSRKPILIYHQLVMADHQVAPMVQTEPVLVKLGQNINDQMKDDKYFKVIFRPQNYWANM